MNNIIILKFNLDDSSLKMIVCITYFVAAFFGGIVMASAGKNRKFLWGMTCGVLYFMIILVVSLIVPGKDVTNGMSVFTCFIICALSGCLGGMFCR
ncbi:MAG: TIGR04086 family membrane protein [Lachnospiraceae bacterium]|nr:TIGR04086 family membrane protein [Lachnospiraceae bacterium]